MSRFGREPWAEVVPEPMTRTWPRRVTATNWADCDRLPVKLSVTRPPVPKVVSSDPSLLSRATLKTDVAAPPVPAWSE